MKLKKIYLLDRSFGPAGAFAGLILFVAGLILVFFSVSGVLLILAGAFAGFTFSGAAIDYERKRVKFSNYIFGIIPTGKWIRIVPGMKIGVKEYKQVYRSFSQGNRATDMLRTDYRVVLYDSGEKEIMQLAKAGAIDSAKDESSMIGNRLGLKTT